MNTYKFETEDSTMLIDCTSIINALSVTQEHDIKLIGLATGNDLNIKCDMCSHKYDYIHLDKCPKCGYSETT